MITDDEEQRWFEHQTDHEREREMDREIAAERGGDRAARSSPGMAARSPGRFFAAAAVLIGLSWYLLR